MRLHDEVSPEIKPGDDFYQYVNEKWLQANPIPEDKSRYGAFAVLDDENTERLKALLEAPDDERMLVNTARAKALYHSAIDEETIEKLGVAPLQPIMDEIAQLKDTDELKAFIGSWHSRGLGLVWRIGMDVDNKDSRRYMVRASQGGLGLPDRDYYFDDGERFEKIRAEYKAFLAKLFELLGRDKAAERAAGVYILEEKLAKVSTTRVEQRDVEATYNPFSLDQLDKEFPGLAWTPYLDQIGFGTPRELVVSQPAFIRTALTLLAEESLESWQDYLVVHCLLPLLEYLPKEFVDLDFYFYGTILTGVEQQEPRYRRAIATSMRMLPEPMGQLFVEAHFDETAKQMIYDLVGHVQAALRERIGKLDWMTEATKKRALEKLETFMPLLGYPDVWKDYTALDVNGSYVENVLAAIKFAWDQEAGRLMGPVDRKEWLMSPAQVNAYYWASTNGITFPAGILQPPFFDASGDFAANYGGIGIVIGHEITHGFDDNGSKFDQVGNMESWWTQEDRKAFEQRAKQLEEQYNAYELEGRHVNGGLTLGENIADLGGTLIAYDALQKKLEETGQRDELDGFTPEQRFFMSLARIWRTNTRSEEVLRRLVVDSHSPAQLRVNGVVPNVDAFYEAFGVKPGDELYRAPEERVRIW